MQSSSSYEHPAVEVTRDTTFEDWLERWRQASPLTRTGSPMHPGLEAMMRAAWEAGYKVGREANL